MKKITCLFTVALMAASAFAGTAKMASEEWVKKLIAKELANYSERRIEIPGTIPARNTNAVEHAGMLTLDNGETVQARIGFCPATNLVLFVRESNVSGVTNNTTFAWNAEMGTWDTVQSTALPSIQCYKYAVDGTNATWYYSATIGGTDYHSALYGGRTYLVPDGSTIQGGRRIELSMAYVSDRKYKAARGNVAPPVAFRTFGLFLSAYAAEEVIDMPDDNGAGGSIMIGYFEYTKAGRTYEFLGDGSDYELDIDGNGSTLQQYGEETFRQWMNNMKAITVAKRSDAIDERACDAESWGLPSTLTGTDGMTITRSNLIKQSFWTDAVGRSVERIKGEHERIFFELYDQLKEHDCPSLGEGQWAWLPEYNCCCQYTYPDLNGNPVHCSKHETPKHLWKNYACDANGTLAPAEGVGCRLCGRCLTRDEEQGSIHVMVPDTDDFDYCGCYCKYYYTKKEHEEEPDEPDPIIEVVPFVPVIPDPNPPAPPPPPPYDPGECDPTDDPGTHDGGWGDSGDSEIDIPDPEAYEDGEDDPGTDDPGTDDPGTDDPGAGSDTPSEETTVDTPHEETQDPKWKPADNPIPVEDLYKPPEDPHLPSVFNPTFVTNELNNADLQIWMHQGWKYVTETFTDKHGRTVTVKHGKKPTGGNLIKHVKPWNPMQCTCKCGVEHWFKPSPCPRVCRGCGWYANTAIDSPEEDVDVLETMRGQVKQWHKEYKRGAWKKYHYRYTWIDKTDGRVCHKWFNWDIRTGDKHCHSPFAKWYAAATNGTGGCGCACGGLRSKPNGSHGRFGYHRKFHVYGEKPVSDIACDFTRYYYQQKGVETIPYCACNNYNWEVSNTDKESDWEYDFDTDAEWIGNVSSKAMSLACPNVCAWHCPSNHISGGSSQLDYHKHQGAIKAHQTMQADVAQAYREWMGARTMDCGCACQAFTRGNCDDFDVDWDEMAKTDYHFIDLFGDNPKCMCECGKNHFAITPKNIETIFPDESVRPTVFWSKCAEESGVCNICGYYTKTGAVDPTKDRAKYDSHYFDGSACHCDCHDKCDALFHPDRYSANVCGWAAEQDGDSYPNNTRMGSSGYISDQGEVLKYHGRAGSHTCDCRESVGHHLYHKHTPGEKCKSVCKYNVGGSSICGHTDNYYTKKNGMYVDDIGEHERDANADYCGCDCGHKVQRDVNGESVEWHCRREDGSMCYCFGRYASGSPFYHVDEPVLIEHVNLAETGDVNEYVETCEICGEKNRYSSREYKCDNDHVMWSQPFCPQKCNHERRTCKRGCGGDCCDCERCTCPYCNMVMGAVDHCTCSGGDSGFDMDHTIKPTMPMLYGDDIDALIARMSMPDVQCIDGDDPVYEIAMSALNSKFIGYPNLKMIRFNYVTNVHDYACKNAFVSCNSLTDVEFKGLVNVYVEGFYEAFKRCVSLKNVLMPNLKIADEKAFTQAFALCTSLEYISFPELETAKFCGLESAFAGCKSLRRASFPKLKNVSLSGLSLAFENCTEIQELEFPELVNVSYGGLVSAFEGCTSLQTVRFPKLTNVSSGDLADAFKGTSVLFVDLTSMTCAQVSALNYSLWKLKSGALIWCSDGTITIP